MNVKKLVLFALSVAMLLSLSACAGKPSGNSKTLGIVMPGETHGFLGESIKHAEKAAKTMSESYDVEYKFLTSADSSEQAAQIDTLISEQVDAIVLWAHDGAEIKNAAEKIMAANIPLVVYDRLVPDLTPTVEVEGDNLGIGQMAGEYFNKFFASELEAGTVYYLEFMGDTSTVPQLRSGGFTEKANANFERVGEQFVTYYQRQTAKEQMEDFLLNNPDADKVSAIYTHDDEVALGILDALQSYDGTTNIKLISGVSGSKEYLDTFEPMLAEYGISQVTYEYSPSMIKRAIEAGFQILDEQSMPVKIIVPTAEVDNAGEAGYRTSTVYVERYEK